MRCRSEFDGQKVYCIGDHSCSFISASISVHGRKVLLGCSYVLLLNKLYFNNPAIRGGNVYFNKRPIQIYFDINRLGFARCYYVQYAN